MSEEKAVQLVNKLLENKSVLQILNTKKSPKDKDELLKICMEIARESGEDITPEDIAEAFETIEKERRQRTDAVAADIEELDDADLENIAGGSEERYWFEDKDPIIVCDKGIHDVCGFTRFLGA